MVAAMSFLGVLDGFLLFISDDLTVWQFHFLRAVAAVALIWLGALVWLGRLPAPRSWSAVAQRSALLSGSMVFFFSAIPLMPIAQVAAGLFTAPLFVVAISAAFGLERVDLGRAAAAAVGFLGAVIMLDPFARQLDWTAALPVCAGLGHAAMLLTTRLKCRDESVATLAFGGYVGFLIVGAAGWAFFAIVDAPAGLAERAPFIFGQPQPIDIGALWFIALLGAGSVVALVAAARAYQLADASFLAPFDYVYIVAAGVTGYLLWGESLSLFSAAGVALIFASGVYLARTARRAAQPA